jgi:sterol desaturase/sphingolipid hydroxylase (fatty acid hydroxylase superfamily)
MPWAIAPIIVSFFAFGALAWLFPCNPEQPRFWPKGLTDDILYFFVSLLFYGALTTAMTQLLVETAAGGRAPAAFKAMAAGYGVLPYMPVALQALVLLAVTDVYQYWMHRAFHGRTLWWFHAVHHSSEQVNWSTTYRIHPVNYLIYSAAVAVLTRLMGFSPAAFAAVTMFNLVHSGLVHANLNWNFGPFRYVLASPVFHRWHHSNNPAVRDKNFAPTFPVLDLMFGTFHMPAGQLPADFGAEGVPDHFLAQMVYPFRALATDVAARNRLAAPADIKG